MHVSDASWLQADSYTYAKNLVHTDRGWERLLGSGHFQQGWQEAHNPFGQPRTRTFSYLLTNAIFDPKNAGLQLKTLQCFNDLRAVGRLVRSHIPAEPSPQRRRISDPGVGGALAGAAYRNIAVALFGKARVEREWDNRSRYLRDRIRRAVRRERDLMSGGYRKFLS